MNILDEEDLLIKELENTDFVKKIIESKKIIEENNLINTSNIYELNKNNTIKEYIKNVNELDLYIYYINRKIRSLINNKICRSKDESN